MRKLLLTGLVALTSLTLGSAQAHIICQMAPGADPNVTALAYGISLTDTTSGAPFAYFTLPQGVTTLTIQTQMVGDPAIVWAEDDEGVTSPETTKGSTLPAVGDRIALYTANRNFLRQINFNVNQTRSRGRSVRIAILDTGLSPNQPYLWNRVTASFNAIEPNLSAFDVPRQQDTNNDGLQDNMTGHGTMVAGIVDQISPQSELLIARVADSDGMASAWSIIKGLAFAKVWGAEVANISLGTLVHVPAMTDVLSWCESNNLAVVAAIGNNGIHDACNPAKIGKAICVGGLLPNNRKAPFSNWHSSCAMSAPATGIVSQDWDGHLANWSGTSFSTPMVSATIAEALRHSRTTKSPERIRIAVEALGNDLNAANPDYENDLGLLLNFTKMINGLKNY
ncbi:MAG: S8 family serine peptidase [Armatimonadetes bacterium]|nr:S8 family serine peptidase [Armatimonadota bacterium]